jgi:CDP-diacylglycerol--glycerol-3-phosphate 3-phosphatidyltransferase
MMLRDIYFAVAMWTFAGSVVVAYLMRMMLRGRARFDRLDADGGSVFLGKRVMEGAYWLLDPPVNLLIALRVTPNMVTLFSLLPALGAGVAVAFGWFGLGCMLATIATLSDIVDGVIARRTGVSSDAGEVIDAAVDRYGEFFLLGGLAFYYRDTWSVLLLVLAAIIGSFMVSYSTAKAEAVRVPAPRGAMRRSERAVYLLVAAGLTSVTKVIFADTPTLSLREAPMILAIAIVAGVSNVSVVQRLGAIIQSLRAREPAPPAHDALENDGIVTKRETPITGG